MSIRSVLSVVVSGAAMCASLLAQAVPDVKLVPSPPGQAAFQLGGSWDKTTDGPRYRDGKWIVVDYGRPLLRGRNRDLRSGADYGKTVNAGAPLWRAGAKTPRGSPRRRRSKSAARPSPRAPTTCLSI